jgi:hypothetical protein
MEEAAGGVDINLTALGILLAVCAVAGVGYRMIVGVRRGYYARRSSWRDAPREFFAATGDAVMTGLGSASRPAPSSSCSPPSWRESGSDVRLN